MENGVEVTIGLTPKSKSLQQRTRSPALPKGGGEEGAPRPAGCARQCGLCGWGGERRQGPGANKSWLQAKVRARLEWATPPWTPSGSTAKTPPAQHGPESGPSAAPGPWPLQQDRAITAAVAEPLSGGRLGLAVRTRQGAATGHSQPGLGRDGAGKGAQVCECDEEGREGGAWAPAQCWRGPGPGSGPG